MELDLFSTKMINKPFMSLKNGKGCFIFAIMGFLQMFQTAKSVLNPINDIKDLDWNDLTEHKIIEWLENEVNPKIVNHLTKNLSITNLYKILTELQEQYNTAKAKYDLVNQQNEIKKVYDEINKVIPEKKKTKEIHEEFSRRELLYSWKNKLAPEELRKLNPLFKDLFDKCAAFKKNFEELYTNIDNVNGKLPEVKIKNALNLDVEQLLRHIQSIFSGSILDLYKTVLEKLIEKVLQDHNANTFLKAEQGKNAVLAILNQADKLYNSNAQKIPLEFLNNKINEAMKDMEYALNHYDNIKEIPIKFLTHLKEKLKMVLKDMKDDGDEVYHNAVEWCQDQETN